VARVLVAPGARDDLERLIRTHSLPPTTRERVRRSLRRLERFPLLGRAIERGRWNGYRFILGPWRWLIVLYKYDAEEDTVLVASFEDGRASTAATVSR
jgi:mRNA-degrading endonuclease RelE of RelBE toxin-antitoxin system